MKQVHPITEQLVQIQKRRQIEYFVLMSVHGFFVGQFLNVLDIVICIGGIFVTVGISWSLTQNREKRRTLPESNRYRIMGDIVEMLGLMFILVCSSIAVFKLGSNLLQYQSHLSVCLLLYFCSTMVFELLWIKRHFNNLSPAQQLNYLINYPRSIILPSNYKRILKFFNQK